MKIGRFSEPQILGILKQADSGVPVCELCQEHGISSESFTSGERSMSAWMAL